MGTFHDNLGELHGVTVAVAAGETVYVGRCHEANDRSIVMLDVDQHAEGEGGQSNADYLQQAARWGVFKKHDRLILDRAEVDSIRPLRDVRPA